MRFEVGLMCGMSGYHVVVWYVVVGLTVVVGDGKYGITLKEERNPRGFIHKATRDAAAHAAPEEPIAAGKPQEVAGAGSVAQSGPVRAFVMIG